MTGYIERVRKQKQGNEEKAMTRQHNSQDQRMTAQANTTYAYVPGDEYPFKARVEFAINKDFVDEFACHEFVLDEIFTDSWGYNHTHEWVSRDDFPSGYRTWISKLDAESWERVEEKVDEVIEELTEGLLNARSARRMIDAEKPDNRVNAIYLTESRYLGGLAIKCDKQETES